MFNCCQYVFSSHVFCSAKYVLYLAINVFHTAPRVFEWQLHVFCSALAHVVGDDAPRALGTILLGVAALTIPKSRHLYFMQNSLSVHPSVCLFVCLFVGPSVCTFFASKIINNFENDFKRYWSMSRLVTLFCTHQLRRYWSRCCRRFPSRGSPPPPRTSRPGLPPAGTTACLGRKKRSKRPKNAVHADAGVMDL